MLQKLLKKVRWKHVIIYFSILSLCVFLINPFAESHYRKSLLETGALLPLSEIDARTSVLEMLVLLEIDSSVRKSNNQYLDLSKRLSEEITRCARVETKNHFIEQSDLWLLERITNDYKNYFVLSPSVDLKFFEFMPKCMAKIEGNVVSNNAVATRNLKWIANASFIQSNPFDERINLNFGEPWDTYEWMHKGKPPIPPSDCSQDHLMAALDGDEFVVDTVSLGGSLAISDLGMSSSTTMKRKERKIDLPDCPEIGR